MKNFWLKDKGKSQGGFPSDDANALQQLADGDFTLDCIYSSQFVQNEVLTPIFESERCDSLSLKFSPVLCNTMTGTIYYKGKAIQIFVQTKENRFTFQDVYSSKVKVSNIRLNLHTGEISFIWNDNSPGDRSYVVSYEYNLECQWTPDQ